jgi:hypothetical protein
MKLRTTAALVLVAAFALVAAGCGGDDSSSGTSADQWAQEFCTTVISFRDDLEQIRDGLGESLSVGSLEDAADEASMRTNDFVDELQALGAPETESGQEVENSVNALADTAEAEKEDVQNAVDGVSDVTDIPGALTTIGASLQEMASALQRTVDAIENEDVDGELRTAFENSSSCDELNSSNSG